MPPMSFWLRAAPGWVVGDETGVAGLRGNGASGNVAAPGLGREDAACHQESETPGVFVIAGKRESVAGRRRPHGHGMKQVLAGGR